MVKKSGLLSALNKDTTPEPAPVSVPASAAASPQKAKAAKPEKGASARDSKAAMTNWLNPAFPATLDMLKAQLRAQGRKATREELVEEGLNLLFEKYNVPVVQG